MTRPSFPKSRRVTIISPEFPPEASPTARMASELSEGLAAVGYEVTVIAGFPNRPMGVVYEGYRRSLRSLESHGQVRLVRCPNWLIGPNRRHYSRILENLTFGLSSLYNLLREARPDILVVETWPILAAQCAFIAAQIWNVPVIYYVQDVYPEIAVDVGVLREGSLVSRLLLVWDTCLCRHASTVVAISDTMGALLSSARNLPPSKVRVVPNWLVGTTITPVQHSTRWRARLGLSEDQFILMYAGTLGLVSGVDILIEVARLLRADRVQILCVGEGPLKQPMVREAELECLENIHFIPFQPEGELSDLLGTADAFILPMIPNARDAAVPSKLITYLAAGRPVVCASQEEGAVAQIVRSREAGILARAGDPADIVRAVRQLAEDPDWRRRLGANARSCFEDHFTFERAIDTLTDLLNTLLDPVHSTNDVRGIESHK